MKDSSPLLSTLYGQLALAQLKTANQVAALKKTLFALDSKADKIFQRQFSIEDKQSQEQLAHIKLQLAAFLSGKPQKPS
jgi:hypothetical protein